MEDGEAIGLLEPELKRFENSRSTIRLSHKGREGIVEISAEDATALRASIDSVAQLLKVYEKMRKER